MLARLLRFSYLFQVLSGALLGVYLLPQGPVASSAVLGGLALPLMSQLMGIAFTMLHSGGGAPQAVWWRAFGGEFRAALTVFWGRLPWAKPQPQLVMPMAWSDSETARVRLPVLLVHGYICNHRIWDDVVVALHGAGHPVLALDLEPLFTSIDDYAAPIEAAVTQLMTQTGAPRVALVGHSMGGLAIRAWMRAYGCERVGRVVTLGTPHQGTRLAKAAFTLNGRQMVWQSTWIQALASSETPALRKLMHIALTQQDNIVYPQREQTLPDANVTEFSGMGHLQMCLDREVITWLVRQLAKP